MNAADYHRAILLRAERLLSRSAAGIIRLGTLAGRRDLARDGAVSDRTWALVDGALAALVATLAALEAMSPGAAGEAWRAGL